MTEPVRTNADAVLGGIAWRPLVGLALSERVGMPPALAVPDRRAAIAPADRIRPFTQSS